MGPSGRTHHSSGILVGLGVGGDISQRTMVLCRFLRFPCAIFFFICFVFFFRVSFLLLHIFFFFHLFLFKKSTFTVLFAMSFFSYLEEHFSFFVQTFLFFIWTFLISCMICFFCMTIFVWTCFIIPRNIFFKSWFLKIQEWK